MRPGWRTSVREASIAGQSLLPRAKGQAIGGRGANLAHGLGPIEALVSAWPALALAGAFELLMTPIRTEPPPKTTAIPASHANQAGPAAAHGAPPAPAGTPPVEQTVRAWHSAGRSQRAIARNLGIDRRKIKRIIDHPPDPLPHQ